MAHTALETFWEQIAEILPSSLDSETAIKLYEKYQECKQMEREQLIEAYIEGEQILSESDCKAQQYYTLTYGNNQTK